MFSISVLFCPFLSDLPHSVPPLPMHFSLLDSCLSCLISSLLYIFDFLVSLTTGTEMVLETQRSWGGCSPVVHGRAAAFPISPRVLLFFLPPCATVLAFSYSHYHCHNVQQPCIYHPSHRGLLRALINHFSLSDELQVQARSLKWIISLPITSSTNIT